VYFPPKNIIIIIGKSLGGGARGSLVGKGAMLKAGRSRVLFPLRSLNISVDLTLSTALWFWS
jgi:hypothetical protein